MVSRAALPENQLPGGEYAMDEVHQFRVVAWWTAGRTGIARSSSAPNAIHFAAPPVFGGLEGRWTPEDLLLGALASCYTTTFRTLAECSKFVYTDLQVEVVGVIGKAEAGCNLVEISICVDLIIPQEAEQERGVNLLHKAKGLCLVSRALAIRQKFEPKVKVGVAVAQGRP
jgi:organic hydroperoxide reductase OsmC/OhrA